MAVNSDLWSTKLARRRFCAMSICCILMLCRTLWGGRDQKPEHHLLWHCVLRMLPFFSICMSLQTYC